MSSMVSATIRTGRDDESYQIWQTDACDQLISGSRNPTISVSQLVEDQGGQTSGLV